MGQEVVNSVDEVAGLEGLREEIALAHVQFIDDAAVRGTRDQ